MTEQEKTRKWTNNHYKVYKRPDINSDWVLLGEYKNYSEIAVALNTRKETIKNIVHKNMKKWQNIKIEKIYERKDREDTFERTPRKLDNYSKKELIILVTKLREEIKEKDKIDIC